MCIDPMALIHLLGTLYLGFYDMPSNNSFKPNPLRGSA